MSEKTYSGRMFITVTFDNLRVESDQGGDSVLSERVGGKVLDDLRRATEQLRQAGQSAAYTFEADLRVLDVTGSSDERVDEPL